jgi:proteic killer suppression protein
MMKVRFGDDRLALVETNQAHRLKLPVQVVQVARRRIRFLREVQDEQDLYSMASLHYEKLTGDREGQRSIRLNGKWRIVLEIDRDCQPLEIVILEISNHYE